MTNTSTEALSVKLQKAAGTSHRRLPSQKALNLM